MSRHFCFFLGLFCCSVVQADIQPDWISRPLAVPGKVHVVGTSTLLLDRAQSLNLATQKARLELMMTLRTSIQGKLDSTSAMQVARDRQGASASSLQQVRQNVAMTTSAQDIPGIRIAETYIDEAGKTVYALAELDLGVATTELVRRQQVVEVALHEIGGRSRVLLDSLADVHSVGESARSMRDLNGLLSSQVDAATDARSRALFRDFEALQKRVFGALTFGLDSEDAANATRQRASLRQVVTSLGLGWTDNAAAYRFRVQFHEEPQSSLAYGMYVLRQAAEVVLLDSNGQTVRSGRLALKGVGASEEQARMQLTRQLDDQLGKLVSSWLLGSR